MNDDHASGSGMEDFTEKARTYWKSQGGSLTTVRKIICDRVARSAGSFDAEKLLKWVREEDKLISLSTVYRTLHSLVEAGLVTEVQGADARSNYHVRCADSRATSHVLCQDCGEVIPVENPCLAVRESEAAQKQGFSPRKISLRYEASCDVLKASGHCERASKKK